MAWNWINLVNFSKRLFSLECGRCEINVKFKKHSLISIAMAQNDMQNVEKSVNEHTTIKQVDWSQNPCKQTAAKYVDGDFQFHGTLKKTFS